MPLAQPASGTYPSHSEARGHLRLQHPRLSVRSGQGKQGGATKKISLLNATRFHPLSDSGMCSRESISHER
jgi:hypothetical protein